jgi:putative acetyltransferase
VIAIAASIRHAVFPEDRSVVAALFAAYAAELDFDLCFQDFDDELAGLPGAYAQPAGCVLLAEDAGAAVACVALRPLAGDVCEMKRLYVAPAGRGRGWGRLLVARIIAAARERGYARMRLDTAPMMTPAIRLYRASGFVEIAPYCENPIPGALFFEKDLAPDGLASDPRWRENAPGGPAEN